MATCHLSPGQPLLAARPRFGGSSGQPWPNPKTKIETLPVSQAVSSRWRALADVLLLERFAAAWPVAQPLAVPPPAPTCLVPVRLEHFVLRHRVARGDSLARIAV